MIRKRIEQYVRAAVEALRNEGVIPAEARTEIEIAVPRMEQHGDYTSNAAMMLAAAAGKKPRELADAIVARIPKDAPEIRSISLAGPGFINFTVNPGWFLEGLAQIHAAGDAFGRIGLGQGRRVQVEFVSANPTGPLHIGHGRGAVYGDVLGNVLAAAGYSVTKEYYVNDAGNQIRTLGRSVYLRLRELQGDRIAFPEDCYQGHYIVTLARELNATRRDEFLGLGEEQGIEQCGNYAAEKILGEIRSDLAETGVTHDTYFHENRLHTDAMVEDTISWLRQKGHVYDQEGAVWFRSTAWGDDKDRVLKKSDGALTYFASDIAYHKNKYDRGFDRVIDIWGADHGGYVARMKAAVGALGHDPASFDAVLIQLVNLVRAGDVVSMSTRSGTYETLEDVRREVGRDACRYFFLMRSHNAQLDFDLDLAKRQSADNPVFYIQYAHARICSIFRKASEQGLAAATPETVDLTRLDLPEETRLARMLLSMPATIEECALELEPHKLAFYLLELSRLLQSYYSRGRADERYRVLGAEPATAAAKLYLLNNVRHVLRSGLNILGISAPEAMAREEDELA